MLTIHRCLALPEPFEPNSIYFVKPNDESHIAITITGSTPDVVYTAISDLEIETLIGKHIAANGRGIVTVDYLPDAAAHSGELFCLAGENSPCWSNGAAWVDLAKLAIERANTGGTTDSDLAKRLRNELQFGIKLI